MPALGAVALARAGLGGRRRRGGPVTAGGLRAVARGAPELPSELVDARLERSDLRAQGFDHGLLLAHQSAEGGDLFVLRAHSTEQSSARVGNASPFVTRDSRQHEQGLNGYGDASKI